MEVLFYCWLVAGQRLEVGVGGGRKRFNILGAFCPDDHDYLDCRYAEQNLNAQSVIALFERMMQKHPDCKHFRIYLDNVRYQHAKVLCACIEQTKQERGVTFEDRKSTRLNSSHLGISYAVFCLKKKNTG